MAKHCTVSEGSNSWLTLIHKACVAHPDVDICNCIGPMHESCWHDYTCWSSKFFSDKVPFVEQGAHVPLGKQQELFQVPGKETLSIELCCLVKNGNDEIHILTTFTHQICAYDGLVLMSFKDSENVFPLNKHVYMWLQYTFKLLRFAVKMCVLFLVFLSMFWNAE